MELEFDVQGNAKATIEDISPLLLEAHLKATGSKLAKQIRNMGVKEVLEQMELLEGPPERQRVKNMALMMFCDYPDKFFPYMQVEITRFPNGSIRDPKNFVEIPPIKGTVPQIIRRTMEKLQDIAIAVYVQKVSGRMEANRFLSYPYEVLEEAIVNAFYHRDYMCYEPVQVEIEPDCIRIISYPGIDRSVPLKVVEKGERFKTGMYRNRRLGEFLKELDLAEGRCAGIPAIQEGLEKNGSPRAVFETDDDRKAVCVTIPIQPEYLKYLKLIAGSKAPKPRKTAEYRSDRDGALEDEMALMVIETFKKHPEISQEALGELIGLSRRTVQKYIKKLKETGRIERVGGRRYGYWKVN